MKKRNRHLVVLGMLLACWLPCEAKHMAVVVDKSNPTANVTSADLAKMLQANTRKWPDGRNITLVLREASSPELQQVLQRIWKMPPEEVKSFLAAHKSSFVTVDSDDAVLKLVESTPGAMGLVDVYSISAKVNVLKVDGKLPLEQGYVLH
jgi:ABC-type phosphate transport system substrate-binding protein